MTSTWGRCLRPWLFCRSQWRVRTLWARRHAHPAIAFNTSRKARATTPKASGPSWRPACRRSSRNARSPNAPVGILVPGSGEWTACYRGNRGKPRLRFAAVGVWRWRAGLHSGRPAALGIFRAPHLLVHRNGACPGSPSAIRLQPSTLLGEIQSADTIYRCFNCHATNVKPGPDLAAMEPGVNCERCHGRGRPCMCRTARPSRSSMRGGFRRGKAWRCAENATACPTRRSLRCGPKKRIRYPCVSLPLA